MKKLLVAALIMASVLAVGTAAWAKEPGVATIDGPGLGAPIVFRFDGDGGGGSSGGDAFFRLIDLTGYWSQSKSTILPDTLLGPGYTMTIVWGSPADPIGTATLEMYPYAQPHPVTFVPNQFLTPAGVGPYTGWFAASPILLSYLVHYGMPESSPVALPAPTPQPVPQPAPQPALQVVPQGFPWGWVVGAGGLTVLLLGGALAGRSRRKVRVTA